MCLKCLGVPRVFLGTRGVFIVFVSVYMVLMIDQSIFGVPKMFLVCPGCSWCVFLVCPGCSSCVFLVCPGCSSCVFLVCLGCSWCVEGVRAVSG